MNLFVSLMQGLHMVLAWPAALWVHSQGWCGRQWERLRPGVRVGERRR